MQANEAILSRTDAQPKDVHAALTALARDLSLLSDPSPRLRRYATAFIDALLDTGQPAAAHKAAAKAVQAGRDLAAPPSLGRDRLRGALELDCSSMPHRELIDAVLALLGRLAAVDRRVVPWLFEAVKQWASAERRVALANLLAVDLRAEDRAAGLAEVLRFAASFDKEDRARGILRELTGACATDGAWMLALLAAVERAPSTGERLLPALYGSELGEPLLGRSPGWLLEPRDDHRRDLERLASSAVIEVRTVAVFLLGQVPGVDVRAAAIALLAGGGWPARQIVSLLIARAVVGPEVVRAIAAARASPPPRASNIQRDEFLEGLAALDQAQSRGDGAIVRVDRDWTVVLLPGLAASPPVVHGDRLLLLHHKILRRAPASEWMTDEDELGFLSLSLGAHPSVAEIRLPVTLPPTRTGASGARRRFSLVSKVGDALVCWLNTPFSDSEGWGSRNYLFAFTPGADRWAVLTPSLAPLSADALEAALPSLGYGELVVWEEAGALKIAIDGTPYHLDDWELSSGTRRSFDARRAAEARLPWAVGLVASGDLPTDERWPLREGRAIVGGRKRIVDAWPAAAKGRLYALAGALLPDGRAALTIRRFAPGEPVRDILLLAPVLR